MARNDVEQVKFKDTTKRERDRVAAVEAALREERRPGLMPLDPGRPRSLDAQTRREMLSGRGGSGDPDAMIGRADRNPLLIAGQMAGTPAAVASTAFGVAKAVHDVKSGHPEELVPAAISLPFGLKLNRLMFASRETPSTMEFLLYDRNNPEAVPRVLEVPYKSSTIGALSPARAGSIDKLATVFAKSPRKFVDILKDGPEKTSLLDYYPEISDTEFLIGSDMGDGTLGMALRNPDTGKPAIVLSKDYLRKGGIETVDGLPVEPLDVVAHEGGAHIPQMIADAYAGTTPKDVFSQAYNDAIAAMAGGERIKVSPRSADNMINYGRLENAVKATYPEDVRNAFFFEPDATDKGILYSLMKDEVEYNAYRNTAGEIHAFDIGARSANPKLRSEPVKEPPENALRFRGSDLGTSQDAKGGNTRSDAKGGDAGSETAVSETPVSEAPAQPSGPRIVINPKVFEDKRDALCVAFNEAFRLVMEENGFEPVSEPTEAQRKFFADTAYANDELQLRRTILARIATLDTSVKDPTDEQLEETAEMLEMVMEVGAPQNQWEQQAVQRLHDVVVKAREASAGRTPEEAPAEVPPEGEMTEQGAQAAMGGGETDEEELTRGDTQALLKATSRKPTWNEPGPELPQQPDEPSGPQTGDVRYVEKDGSYFKQTFRQGESEAGTGWTGQVISKDEWDAAQSQMKSGKDAAEAAGTWNAGAQQRKDAASAETARIRASTEQQNRVNAMYAEGKMNKRTAREWKDAIAGAGVKGVQGLADALDRTDTKVQGLEQVKNAPVGRSLAPGKMDSDDYMDMVRGAVNGVVNAPIYVAEGVMQTGAATLGAAGGAIKGAVDGTGVLGGALSGLATATGYVHDASNTLRHAVNFDYKGARSTMGDLPITGKEGGLTMNQLESGLLAGVGGLAGPGTVLKALKGAKGAAAPVAQVATQAAKAPVAQVATQAAKAPVAQAAKATPIMKAVEQSTKAQVAQVAKQAAQSGVRKTPMMKSQVIKPLAQAAKPAAAKGQAIKPLAQAAKPAAQTAKSVIPKTVYGDAVSGEQAFGKETWGLLQSHANKVGRKLPESFRPVIGSKDLRENVASVWADPARFKNELDSVTESFGYRYNPNTGRAVLDSGFRGFQGSNRTVVGQVMQLKPTGDVGVHMFPGEAFGGRGSELIDKAQHIGIVGDNGLFYPIW